MQARMNSAYVCPNPVKNNTVEETRNSILALQRVGIAVYMAEKCAGMSSGLRDVVFLPECEALSRCDFVFTVGGDGTVLHFAKDAAHAKKPILGVNAGTFGFMPELEPDELYYLERLKTGDFYIDPRMMLDVAVLDEAGRSIYSDIALNDAVVARGEEPRALGLALSVGGSETLRFSADGVIISTPTGSTAYSLSAGGPIIEPQHACISITPISPHALHIKAMVVSAESEVILWTTRRDGGARLAVDGRPSRRLAEHERVRVTKSPTSVSLIRLKNRGFYDIISKKFSGC